MFFSAGLDTSCKWVIELMGLTLHLVPPIFKAKKGVIYKDTKK